MTHEQLVEKVARVICDQWGYVWDGDPDDEQTAPEQHEPYDTRPCKGLYRKAARAAIAAIYEAMREPSAKMVDGMASNIRGAGFSGDSYLLARVCHAVMLDASPLKGE